MVCLTSIVSFAESQFFLFYFNLPSKLYENDFKFAVTKLLPVAAETTFYFE
jgi:hypothetical protein